MLGRLFTAGALPVSSQTVCFLFYSFLYRDGPQRQVQNASSVRPIEGMLKPHISVTKQVSEWTSTG